MKIGNVKGNAAKGKYLCGIQQLKTMRATASYSYPPRLTATALGPRDLVHQIFFTHSVLSHRSPSVGLADTLSGGSVASAMLVPRHQSSIADCTR